MSKKGKGGPIGIVITNQNAPAELIKRLGANAQKAVSLATFKCAQHAEGEIRRTVRQVFNPGTGELSRRWETTFIKKSGDVISAAALSDLVYARVQNEGSGYLPGGVIRSSRGKDKNLAIPFKGEFRPPAPWPSQFPKGTLAFIPSKKADVTGVLVEKLAKGGTGKIWYILKKSVKIKGKRYIEKALEKSKPEWPRVFNERLQELVDEAAAAANKKG